MDINTGHHNDSLCLIVFRRLAEMGVERFSSELSPPLV
jgi:hypothetical protein